MAGYWQYVRKFDRSLWVLSVGWFVSALGFAASLPFIAIYFSSEFGMSMTQIGAFFGVLAVVRSLFQAVGGEVSDRLERLTLLITSQYVRAISFAGIAVSIYFSLGFWWVASFLVVNSILGAVFMPVANALVSDILGKKERLDGYAITRAAGNLGWAVGPAIGGFLATSSYAMLFVISAFVTVLSALVFRLFMRPPAIVKNADRFRIKDLIAIRNDPLLAVHVSLLFILYLVVAQLIVPFSVYSVDVAGISQAQLGFLFTLNGLLVVALQIPVTRLLARYTLSSQLAVGSLFYTIGYGMVGLLVGFEYFIIAIVIVTIGEVFMSPPSLTLTSRLAPETRMGRYMGIHGFFLAAGWSLGPLYGGIVLDSFADQPAVAWTSISSLALISAVGYFWFKRRLPEAINRSEAD